MNRSGKRDLGVEAGGKRAQIHTGHWEVTWNWWPKRDEDVTSPDVQWRTFLIRKKWANAKALKYGDTRKFPRRLINGTVGFSGGTPSCMVRDEVRYQVRLRRSKKHEEALAFTGAGLRGWSQTLKQELNLAGEWSWTWGAHREDCQGIWGLEIHMCHGTGERCWKNNRRLRRSN